MLLFLAAAALASPVDDLAIAAQQGMPATILQAYVDDLGTLTSEDIVKLLRSGVPERMIAEAAPGHPLEEELAAARAAGPLLYVRPVPGAERSVEDEMVLEYKGLTESAWVHLVGKEIILTTRTGTLAGTLTGVHGATPIDPSDTITLDVGGEATVVDVRQVVSVRRQDGKQVATVTRADYRAREVEEQIRTGMEYYPGDRAERAMKTGNSLVGGGVAMLALTAISLVAASVETNAAMSTIGDSNAETLNHTNAALTWSAVSYGSASIGVPLLVGGIIVVSINNPER